MQRIERIQLDVEKQQLPARQSDKREETGEILTMRGETKDRKGLACQPSSSLLDGFDF